MKAIFNGLAAVAALLLLAPPTCSGQSYLPSSEQFRQVCNPSDPMWDRMGSELIPTFPRQFSFLVEASIVNENRSLWVQEFFDDVNNRAAVTFFNDGTREHVILDYTNDEVFIIPGFDNESECTVHPLTTDRFINFTFGVTNVNGSLHIGSARQLLLALEDDTPARFIGFETIRGVPSLRYQACIDLDNLSFVADYSYTTDNWTYSTLINPEDYNMVLSQLVIQGNSLNKGNLSNFYHVYSIVAFQSGPSSVPDRALTVPVGLACRGRIPGIPVPVIPKFFSTYIQYVDLNSATNKEVNTVREYYDYTHNLFRADFYYDGRHGVLDRGPYQVIHDFDGQVQYIINRHTSNCTISGLGSSRIMGDIRFDNNGRPQLVTPSQLFYLGSGYNYTYEGVSTVRGVKVDSWIATRDNNVLNPNANLTDGVYEIFFTRPEYTIHTDRSVGASIVPWRLNFRGTVVYVNSTTNETVSNDVNYESDFFDFSTSEPPYDAFDVSVCFSGEASNTVALAFPVSVVGIDFSEFRTNLRASLVNATGLRPLQINNIHIVGDNTSHIIVALILTNLSDLTQVSNTVVTADEAVQGLVNSAEFGQPLPFKVDVSNGVFVSPVLISRRPGRGTNVCNMTMNNTTSNCTTPTTSTTAAPCDSNITNRFSLTDGIVAGIAVGLFFAGFIVALLLLCVGYVCIKCCFGKGSVSIPSAVKYKKHDNELEAFS